MDIRHDEAAGRFTLEREGGEAVLDYRLHDDGRVIHFLRTWVPPHLRGRGYGAVLVKAGLEHAAAAGLRVTTSCWFVDEYLERNPQYAELVER